ASPEPGLPHVCQVLRVAGPGPAQGRRALVLTHGGGMVRLVVDGPIRIEALAPERIVAAPTGLPPGRFPSVAGFARDGDRLVVLLDIPALIELTYRCEVHGT